MIELLNKIPEIIISISTTAIVSYIFLQWKQIKAIKNSQLAIIRSQIISKVEIYIEKGYLPEYARYCLEELYKNYKILGGNHGVEILVHECFKLPLKMKEG